MKRRDSLVLFASFYILTSTALFGAAVTVGACNATSAQIDATIADAARDGACIAIALVSGGDPLTCSNATEQLVLDVAADIEAKPATLSMEQKANVDAARLRMVTRLADKKSGGK